MDFDSPVVGVWRREVGDLSTRRFSQRLAASEVFFLLISFLNYTFPYFEFLFVFQLIIVSPVPVLELCDEVVGVLAYSSNFGWFA